MGRRWQKVLGILCSFVSLFVLLRLYTKQTNNRSWLSWHFVFHFCVHTFKFCSFALNNKETSQNTLQLLVMFHSSSLFISFSLSVCLCLSLSLSLVRSSWLIFIFCNWIAASRWMSAKRVPFNLFLENIAFDTATWWLSCNHPMYIRTNTSRQPCTPLYPLL